MTSLFEHSTTPLPVDLMRAGGRGISLIEFFAIEEEAAERMRQEASTCHPEETAEWLASEQTRQTRAMVDAARADAVAEARQDFEQEMEDRLAEERERVEQVCLTFASDRQRYFAAAEAQVVGLALAIARRVLSREVSRDGMHLEATVRAALARLQDGSTTTLRVCEPELAAYAALFAKGCVTVLADASLSEGECVLETEVGRVELGVNVQLAEIERGFDDLTRRRGA